MPKPEKGESEKDFVARCMAYPDLRDKDAKQRAAICYSLYKNKDNKEYQKYQKELEQAVARVRRYQEEGHWVTHQGRHIYVDGNGNPIDPPKKTEPKKEPSRAVVPLPEEPKKEPKKELPKKTEPVKGKEPEDKETEQHLDKLVEAGYKGTKEQVAKKKEMVRGVLNRMSAKAKSKGIAKIDEMHLFDTHQEFLEYAKSSGHFKRPNKGLRGYLYNSSTLASNGIEDSDDEPAKDGIFAHEFMHAIDRGINKSEFNAPSRSDEWKKAWKEELLVNGMDYKKHRKSGEKTPPPLTSYATHDAHEGFAEFGRLLFTGHDVSKFPQCMKFFEDNGLTKGDDE